MRDLSRLVATAFFYVVPYLLTLWPYLFTTTCAGTSALMHSYDYGYSWRRTSGFEPFIEKYKDESEEGKLLHDYSLATFGGRYNRKHNSIDFFCNA